MLVAHQVKQTHFVQFELCLNNRNSNRTFGLGFFAQTSAKRPESFHQVLMLAVHE